jgi:hypothetical protein
MKIFIERSDSVAEMHEKLGDLVEADAGTKHLEAPCECPETSWEVVLEV